MKNTFTIKIDKKIDDTFFMEHCLNLVASGYDPTLLIGFYALGNGWNLEKFGLLYSLIENNLKVCRRKNESI